MYPSQLKEGGDGWITILAAKFRRRTDCGEFGTRSQKRYGSRGQVNGSGGKIIAESRKSPPCAVHRSARLKVGDKGKRDRLTEIIATLIPIQNRFSLRGGNKIRLCSVQERNIGEGWKRESWQFIKTIRGDKSPGFVQWKILLDFLFFFSFLFFYFSSSLFLFVPFDSVDSITILFSFTESFVVLRSKWRKFVRPVVVIDSETLLLRSISFSLSLASSLELFLQGPSFLDKDDRLLSTITSVN